MAAELQMTFPIAVATPRRHASQRLADSVLRASARFWFVVTIAGQLLFAFTVASFYILTAARGDFCAWNRHMMHGYVAGDRMGNVAVAPNPKNLNAVAALKKLLTRGVSQ